MKNVLNEITRWLITSIIAVITLVICAKQFYEDNNVKVIDSVQLHTQYKKYIVLDKYSKKDLYILKLKNPMTKNASSVAISEWIYYNLYFVGDTIK